MIQDHDGFCLEMDQKVRRWGEVVESVKRTGRQQILNV